MKEDSIVFAGFPQRMAELPSTFTGKFPILEAFEVGVGGDVPAVEGRMGGEGLGKMVEVGVPTSAGSGFKRFPGSDGVMEGEEGLGRGLMEDGLR